MCRPRLVPLPTPELIGHYESSDRKCPCDTLRRSVSSFRKAAASVCPVIIDLRLAAYGQYAPAYCISPKSHAAPAPGCRVFRPFTALAIQARAFDRMMWRRLNAYGDNSSPPVIASPTPGDLPSFAPALRPTKQPPDVTCATATQDNCTVTFCTNHRPPSLTSAALVRQPTPQL